MSSKAKVITPAEEEAGPSTRDEGAKCRSCACNTDFNGTMPATDREVTASFESRDESDCDDKISMEQESVSNCVSNPVLYTNTSGIPSSNSNSVGLWGELTSPAVGSSNRTNSVMTFSSGEELFPPQTISSSSGGFVPSPGPSGDEAEVDEETTVEESEDERCATPPFPVLSSKPVKGESFCACYQNGADSGLYCTCGEEDSGDLFDFPYMCIIYIYCKLPGIPSHCLGRVNRRHFNNGTFLSIKVFFFFVCVHVKKCKNQ